jgi:Major tropism determinant N-terminal domain
MAVQTILRSGTTSEHTSFTGAAAEVTVDTTKQTLVVHAGGSANNGEALLREDLNNAVAGTWSSTSSYNLVPPAVAQTTFARYYHEVLNADGVWRAQTAKVLTVSTATYTLGSNGGTYTGGTTSGDVYDAEAYIRFTYAGAKTVTIPLNSTYAFPIGTTISGVNASTSATAITIALASGVTLNGGTVSILTRAATYTSFMLIKVGTNVWDLTGDLA